MKTKYEPTKPPVFWAKAEHKAAVDAQMAADESVIKSEYAQTYSNECNSDFSKALIADDAAEDAEIKAAAAEAAAIAAKAQATAIRTQTKAELATAKTDADAAKKAADTATTTAETATENAEAKLKIANDTEVAEKKKFEDTEELLKRKNAKAARDSAVTLARAAAQAEKDAADLEKLASFARAKADAAYTTGTCQPAPIIAPVVCAPIPAPIIAPYCPPAYAPYTYTATNYGRLC